MKDKNKGPEMEGQTETTVFNIKQINCKPAGEGSLLAAAKHNKRTITDASGRHDPSKAHLNRSLLGLPATPEGVADLAAKLLDQRGYRPKRRDATIAAEGVFGLLEAPASFDMLDYFTACAQWLEGSLHGSLLSADVHVDEDHPHCHVLVLLPVSNEEGAPSGSDLVGFKQSTNERRRDLQVKVASRYGLQVVMQEVTAAQRKVLARDIHSLLAARADPSMSSVLWPWISQWINRDPMRLARDLGIEVRPANSVAVLAQTTGRGPRTEAAQTASGARMSRATQSDAITQETRNPTPMGVGCASAQDGDEADSDQHPCPVGVAGGLGVQGHLSGCQNDKGEAITRVRDSDLSAYDWDPIHGEHRPATPAGMRPVRHQVADLLAGLGHTRHNREAMACID